MADNEEPFVLHDMPTADGDWAVVTLPMDTPGEVTEKVRAAIRDWISGQQPVTGEGK